MTLQPWHRSSSSATPLPRSASGTSSSIDLNFNGHYDAGEGVDGVSVRLFSPGLDGQIDGGDDVEIQVGPDGILGTPDDATGGMQTASGGAYLFQRLAPGSYYVSIPASQFSSGNPLVGLLSLPGQGGDASSR